MYKAEEELGENADYLFPEIDNLDFEADLDKAFEEIEALHREKNDDDSLEKAVSTEDIASAKTRGLVPKSGDWQKPRRWVRPEDADVPVVEGGETSREETTVNIWSGMYFGKEYHKLPKAKKLVQEVFSSTDGTGTFDDLVDMYSVSTREGERQRYTMSLHSIEGGYTPPSQRRREINELKEDFYNQYGDTKWLAYMHSFLTEGRAKPSNWTDEGMGRDKNLKLAKLITDRYEIDDWDDDGAMAKDLIAMSEKWDENPVSDDSSGDENPINIAMDIIEWAGELGLLQDDIDEIQTPDTFTVGFRISDRLSPNKTSSEPDGVITRKFWKDRNGYLHVEHELFQLAKHSQQMGVSADVMEHAEKIYEKLGVKSISLTANLSVGGYSWARQGYDFVEETNDISAIRKHFILYLTTYTDPKNKKEFPKGVALAEGIDLDSAIEQVKGFKHSWEFANFNPNGREQGKHLGKDLMLGTKWKGKKSLDKQSFGYKLGKAYFAAKRNERNTS